MFGHRSHQTFAQYIIHRRLLAAYQREEVSSSKGYGRDVVLGYSITSGQFSLMNLHRKVKPVWYRFNNKD